MERRSAVQAEAALVEAGGGAVNVGGGGGGRCGAEWLGVPGCMFHVSLLAAGSGGGELGDRGDGSA